MRPSRNARTSAERRGRGGVARHDDGDADLAHHRVGPGDHRHVGHAGVGGQRGLDLGRVHVVAAADEHLLGPPGEAHQAVGLDAGQVAGPQPAVGGDGRRGGLGVAPVARHLGGGAQPQLAHLAGRDLAPVVVAGRHLDAAPRPADAVQRLVVAGVEGGARAAPARLGRGVADRVGRAERGARGRHQGRRRGRAAHRRSSARAPSRAVRPRASAASARAGVPRRRSSACAARRWCAGRRRPATGRGCACGWPSAGTRAAWS